MSVEFDTPANRIIQQLQPKNQFALQTNLPDLTFLRHLSVLGRLRYNSDSGVSTLTLTPPTGETLFIFNGIFTSGAAGATTFTIKNDGTTRISFLIPANGFQQTDLFDSLVGDGTKAFTVASNSVNGAFTMFTWVENTARIRDVAT